MRLEGKVLFSFALFCFVLLASLGVPVEGVQHLLESVAQIMTDTGNIEQVFLDVGSSRGSLPFALECASSTPDFGMPCRFSKKVAIEVE